MKRLNRNVSPRDAALQERPEILKAVCVNATVYVLSRVVYDLMSVFGCESFIRLQCIGVESRASSDVLAYLLLQYCFAAIRDDSSANLAALALINSHDGSLVLSASPGNPALALRDVHVSCLAPDEGFVYFDFAANLGTKEIVLHYEPDAMEHEPCRFLSDLNITCNLIAADAVLAVGDEPSCGEPLVQRNRGIFHHGANLDGELALCMVLRASPSAPLLAEFDGLATASGANDLAIWPASDSKVVDAVVGIREEQNGLLQALWFVAHVVHHEQHASLKAWSSQVNYCPNLILDAAGNLYGTASQGGCCGQGTVYEFSAGSLIALHGFSAAPNGTNSDGEFPEGGLIFDSAGNLYGTAAYAGIDAWGTVYEIQMAGATELAGQNK
jgi:uncharacterized repeat protein (TIGR03803 family)